MKLRLLFAFLLFPLFVFSQKEYNFWAFGDKAGLNFNNGITAVETALSSNEGCASICDAQTGKLLFYSDGMQVYNASHDVMAGTASFPPGGNTDAIQCALIAKQPGSENIYYLFTNNGNSIRYNIIDMKGDAGRGELIAGSTLIRSGTSEGLAGVMHCNGSDIWIVTEILGVSNLYGYLLSDQGLSIVPAISNLTGSPGGKASMIIFNPQGDKLALSRGSGKHIYKFNNRTGKIESLLVEIPNHGYGHCFSPDGQLFYMSEFTYKLVQYDLRTIDSPSSLQKHEVAGSGVGFGSIAMGPDGKGYVTSFGYSDYLHVINNPNKLGSACDFLQNAVYLAGQRSIFGLPNMVAGIVEKQPKPEVNISYTCSDDTTLFLLENDTLYDSVKWDLFNSNGSLVYHTSEAGFDISLKPGDYKLRLLAYSPCRVDTLDSTVALPQPIPYLRVDTTICSNGSVYLNADIGRSATYLWSTGETSSNILVKDTGYYQVNVQAGDCHIQGLFIVNKAPNIWVALGREYFICDDENELAKLDAGKGFDRYLWHPTGDTTQWIIVENTGEYYVIVEDFRGCKGEGGTVVRRRCPGYLYFPTSFSPNNDGLNDVFMPVGQDIESYELSIYNRWGERIFHTKDIHSGWDGTFNNAPSPQDSYIRIAKYSYYDKDRFIRNNYEKGTVKLIR